MCERSDNASNWPPSCGPPVASYGPVVSSCSTDVASARDDVISSPAGHQSRPPGDLNVREYKMDHPRRGAFIIFNNKNFNCIKKLFRMGSDRDARALEERFSALGFSVQCHTDLTTDDMVQTLKKVCEEDHSDCDALGCAILSHGKDGTVLGSDRKQVELEQLLAPLKDCPTLTGKPKVIVIQACRGDLEDDGILAPCVPEADDTDGSSVPAAHTQIYKLPSEADFLYAYSTVSGYGTYRDPGAGSWFIQSLCAELMDGGTTSEVLHLLTRVNYRVATQYKTRTGGKKMMPSVVTQLTKQLYFRPKNH